VVPAKTVPIQDERLGAPAPVECERCGARVLAAKFSPQHTMVQWDDAAVRTCAEFMAFESLGQTSARVAGCDSLRDSIDVAVKDGRLEVAPPG